jgi:hypothetical protein
MSQSELLKDVVGVLDHRNVPYMLTGSYASSFQGYPRSSHDIDLVIELGAAQIDDLMQAFPAPRFYCNRSAILEAVRQRSMFTISEIDTGDKVDFWLLKRTPFDQARFRRRIQAEVSGAHVWLTSPEDTILQKLRWAEDCGGSEKQWKDAMSVFRVQHDRLDFTYLRDWAAKLDVAASLQRLISESAP